VGQILTGRQTVKIIFGWGRNNIQKAQVSLSSRFLVIHSQHSFSFCIHHDHNDHNDHDTPNMSTKQHGSW
jgi:hypothetical protein